MKRFQAFLLAFALLVTLSSVALAHDRDDDDRGRDQGRWGQRHDNGRHNGWYKHRDNDDRDRDRNRNRGYRGNGGYYGNGNYGYPSGGYGNAAASQWGYRDGLQAGQRDRSSGHSCRPTQWEAYRDADHGMSSSGGYYNSNQYKQQYRQAFMQGYQQGYGNGYGYGNGTNGRYYPNGTYQNRYPNGTYYPNGNNRNGGWHR